MRIAVTGGTGFIGRYVIHQLASEGNQVRAWRRASSDTGGFDEVADRLEWVEGQLGDAAAAERLVEGCDAIVHGALWRTGAGFQGGEGDILPFIETNILGTLRLIEAARRAGVGRFVFISTCAVHDKILDDRPLDEAHPLWPASHYGAHKAAIEKFVHSYALGEGYSICALRPTGVYGVNRPVEKSKWYDLVMAVARGESVECRGGGKEVHAADVARAASLLLKADGVAGEAYSCYDRYVSQYEVATLAKEISGSQSEIRGEPKQPKHQIVTQKLRDLGMQFGGRDLLEQTIRSLAESAR